MSDVDDTKPRNAQEVAQRILGVLASVGNVHFPEKNSEWIEQESIYQYLTVLVNYIRTLFLENSHN